MDYTDQGTMFYMNIPETKCMNALKDFLLFLITGVGLWKDWAKLTPVCPQSLNATYSKVHHSDTMIIGLFVPHRSIA